MSTANVELVRSGFEAATRGELDAIASLLAPDVKWHGGVPSDPGACQNREQALHFISRALRAGRLGRLLDVIDAGDEHVVVVLQPGDVDGVTPAPRANVTSIRNGQVVEMIAFESPAAALAHVGADRRSL